MRRGHGDLHLANIALIAGEPVLFDAVEFSDAIASGDVLYDLAFLLMDLEARGLSGAANRLFNAYLAPEPPEALDGLSALQLFLSLRAAIRAKIEAARADEVAAPEERARARALACAAISASPCGVSAMSPPASSRSAGSRERERARLRKARPPPRPGAGGALAAQRRRAQGDVRRRRDREAAG